MIKKGQLVQWEINPKHVYEVIYLYADRALIARMSKQVLFPIVHDVRLIELQPQAGQP